MSDRDLIGEFQENYRYAHDFWGPFISAARVYTLAASGYTWSDAELKELQKSGREPLEFNIMRRPLQFFSGYLRDNIKSIVIAPVEGSDQKTADQFTKLSYYTWDKGEGNSIFLDTCDESNKSGIALCGVQMDYSKDFINGDVSFYKRTFNSFYLDPTFERIDLKDCAFAITRDLIDRSYVKQLIPFVDPEIIDNIQRSFRDDKFLSYHPNFTTLSRNKNLMAYDQYYRKVTKKRKFLVDLDSSFYRDITDLEKEEIQKLKIGIKRFSEMRERADELDIDKNQLPHQLDIQEVEREFVELNIMLNGQPVYTGDDKTGINQTYPFVPVICYMEPSIWMPSQRIQGIASASWSIQRQFNKRHMKIIDIMDTSLQNSYKYLLGSVPDPEEFQQSGPNRIIGVDPDNAPQGLDSVQQLSSPDVNPSLIQYQQVLDQLTLTLSNVNESILGIDDKGNTQVSGRLAQVRIAQGLRSNRKIFDNVEVSQKILGNLVLKAIQSHYTPAKVKRILGEEPTEQFYEKDFEQYDAVIKEGVYSQSQRDAYYYELVSLKRDQIVDVPQTAIIDALQMAGVSDLKDSIAKQEEAAKAQQAKVSEQEKIAIELANAQKEQLVALAQERRARVVADIGLAQERSSQAAKDEASATLDRAKTMVEIAKLNDDRLLQALEFVNRLAEKEAIERNKVTAQTADISNSLNTETEGSAENKQQTAAQQQMQEQQNQQQNVMQNTNLGG